MPYRRSLGGIPLPRYEFKYRRPPRRRLRLSRALLALAALLLLAYPFFEAYHLTVDRHVAAIADLPKNLKNLKIVYVTDIHESARYPQARVDALVKAINGLSADLVLFGGDYADTPDGAFAFFQRMPKVYARLGVYGILGECDLAQDQSNLTALVKAMTNAGVLPLVNTMGKVKVGTIYLYVAGSDDYENGHPDLKGLAAQVRSDDFVILLAHTPDLLPDALKAAGSDGDNHWFDLALFGHTHGGQVTLFGLPLLPNFVPDVGRRYLSGWLEENRASLLVSNGVGTSYFPARLFAPSQIHLITLKQKTT